MWHLTFSATAAKLLELQAFPAPSVLVKPLMHDLKSSYRLRVGSYRIIFSLDR